MREQQQLLGEGQALGAAELLVEDLAAVDQEGHC
jgi:hypothetical protein